MVHPSLAVVEHNLVTYRRTWRGTAFSAFGMPVLFLVAMGWGAGAYVNSAGTGGVAYLDYIAPGILMGTAMQVALGEVEWPVYGCLHWSKIFHAMRATSLRPTDILAGQILSALLRALLSATAFLVVMVAVGATSGPSCLLALPLALLLAMSVAPLVAAFSATISTDSLFTVLIRLAVVPMTLFAGVYFPVEIMPTAVRWLAYASPLWHAVVLCRAATLGHGVPVGSALLHLGYLLAWTVPGCLLARWRFRVALTD